MCGRFAQYQDMADYLQELAGRQDIINDYDNVPTERYNVTSSPRTQLLHSTAGGLAVAAAK